MIGNIHRYFYDELLLKNNYYCSNPQMVIPLTCLLVTMVKKLNSYTLNFYFATIIIH